MSISALIVFGLALVVAAGSPGPSIVALVARVLTSGVRDVLPFLAAMWIGEALWLTLAVTGLAVVAKSFAALFLVLKIAGIAYLLFLAVKMWFAPAVARDGELPSGERPWRMFTAGLMVTLGNPKIMVFYLALLPSIIDVGRVSALGWAELTATMFAVLAMVDIGWAMAAAQARRLLRTPRAVRIINRAGATVMAGAAVAMAAK
jgi:threonine/homoserine/homoserine lactone efflux protein